MIVLLKAKTARSYLYSSAQNTGMWRKNGRTEFLSGLRI